MDIDAYEAAKLKCEELIRLYTHREGTSIYGPPYEKTNNVGFRPGMTQTGLYSHRSRLEA